MMKKVRHFKTLLDINKNEFLSIIERAVELKKLQTNNAYPDTLKKKLPSFKVVLISFKAGLLNSSNRHGISIDVGRFKRSLFN